MNTVSTRSLPFRHSQTSGLIGLLLILTLSFPALKGVTAETAHSAQTSPSGPANSEQNQPLALPYPISFMLGTVTFTWRYRRENSMPFTEHHTISSENLTTALNENKPIRVATKDSGELLLATLNDTPEVILSARRYADWTLISVLRNDGDLTRSSGVFKFCSIDTNADECASSVLQYPDGTVTMTKGAPSKDVTDLYYNLDSAEITDKLIALLSS